MPYPEPDGFRVEPLHMSMDPAITSGIDTYQLAQFVTRAGAVCRPTQDQSRPGMS